MCWILECIVYYMFECRRVEAVIKDQLFIIVSGQKCYYARGDVLYWFMVVYKDQIQILSFKT